MPDKIMRKTRFHPESCEGCRAARNLSSLAKPLSGALGAVTRLWPLPFWQSESVILSGRPRRLRQIVWMRDGKIVNGLIRNETSAELLLTTGPNQEVRVPRAEVEEVRPSTVSVMPAGLDKQLTAQELADLVAFLKNAK